MTTDRYTWRVTWSPEDGEHVGLCTGFPSLSWLAETPEGALAGIRQLVKDVVADLQSNGEAVPEPLADRRYSGEFRVRIPPELHRDLAMQAAEQGVKVPGQQPGIGRPIEDMPDEFREWIIDFGDSGYVARYRIDSDAVTILAVRHQEEVGY